VLLSGCREWYLREELFGRGFTFEGREISRGDLFIFGDVDEIPKPEAIRALRKCSWQVLPGKQDCAAMEGSFHYFSFSWYAGECFCRCAPGF
jgi:beta-1,4-mannosyl-glycoprotein beta-1,4-N-acetylglucosaminyltransferase